MAAASLDAALSAFHARQPVRTWSLIVSLLGDAALPPGGVAPAGAISAFCSLAGLARLTDRDPRELVRAAEIGEPEALALWRLYGERLGQGLTSLIYLFTPELVLLGGGLSAACPFFLPAAQVEIEQRVLAVSREGLTIRPAALGNGAGALGAARLALDRIAATGVDRLG
jgi:glucokinase